MSKIFPMALLVMMISGCQQQDQALDSQQLAGQRFILQSVDAVAASNPPGQLAEIAFSSDLRLSAKMCNRLFGQGELNGNVLTVKQMGSTRMLCNDEQLGAWDNVLTATLAEGALVTLEQGNLTLSGAGHTLKYKADE